MSIDATIVELFERYTGPEQLPTDRRCLDDFVRLAVGVLGYPALVESAKRVLHDVDSRASGRYLVAALSDPSARDHAQAILTDYGPSWWTVQPLVQAFRDERSRDAAEQLIFAYGQNKFTENYLALALGDPEIGPRAKEILMQYRLDKGKVIKNLLKALGRPAAADDARTIFAHYAQYKTMAHQVTDYLAHPECGPYVQEALVDNDFGQALLAKKLKRMLEDSSKREIAVAVIKHFKMNRPSLGRMLVEVLHDATAREDARSLLEYFGPSKYTVKPLVGALRDESLQPVVSGILKQYGSCEATVWPLVLALKDPDLVHRQTFMGLLEWYGPSELTRSSLSRALNEPERADAARAVLTRYDAVSISP